LSRSSWKGTFVCRQTRKNLIKIILLKKKYYTFFFYRNTTLISYFKRYSLKVHTGKKLKKNYITKLHSLRKVGEFSFTRKPFFYPLKKKKL
jgi:ribosomal protein S19